MPYQKMRRDEELAMKMRVVCCASVKKHGDGSLVLECILLFVVNEEKRRAVTDTSLKDFHRLTVAIRRDGTRERFTLPWHITGSTHR